MKKIIRLIALGILLVVFGFASAGETTEASTNENSSKVQIKDSSVDLASYLRQVPGIDSTRFRQ